MTEQVNIPLLRKAVEWAEAEAAKPDGLSEWLQATWETHPDGEQWERSMRRAHGVSPECGTTYCIAGYICAVEGFDTKGGWAEQAASALGIEWEESSDDDAEPANRLFHASNTIADVRRIAEDIAGERL